MHLKNGKNLIIRKAEETDAQEILDYLNIVGGESDNLLFGANEITMTVDQEKQYIKSLHDSETSALLIGLIDHKIVCIGSISAPTKERIAHNGEIALSVLKKFWGMGIGNYLMSEIISFARNSEKLEILHLSVKADNISAIALYKKWGFQEFGRYPNFFKINGSYYDEILMHLYI